jgi:ABC-type multidrug transport system permease subunit
MEIPYVFVQIMLFMFIAYPMIGYAWEAAKFFWFFYTMFCTLLYFLYLGMMMVSITPNIQVASILASMFYTIQNLMSGFIVPAPVSPSTYFIMYFAPFHLPTFEKFPPNGQCILEVVSKIHMSNGVANN